MKKILSIALCLMLVLALTVPVFAVSNHTPVTGGTCKIEKYLVMNATATVPNVTFSFSIVPGTAVAGDDTHMAIKAGDDAEGVTVTAPGASIGTAVFTVGQTTYDAAAAMNSTGTQQGSQANDPVDLTGGKKYARSEATVDFSNLSFTRPGVYRYVVTEQANPTAANMGVTVDNSTKYLDVYVVSDNTGALSIEGYVLHSDASYRPEIGATASDATNKAKGFINTYDSYDLTLSKTVTGNQGDKDEYFKFTVAITDAGNGTSLPVVKTNATHASNPASVTVGADGTVSQDFYLRHGENIVIQGLPANAKYTITETADSTYTVSTSTTEGNGSAVAGTGKVVTDTNGITGNTSVAYTNNRQGAIPTGIMLGVAPFAAAAAIGGAGVAGLIAKNKKKSDKEED